MATGETGLTALLGIATPLSDVSMSIDQPGSVIAIVSVQLGMLTVDASPGAAIHGNGSNLLWISGTVAQVNAKLATLGYAGATAGTDTLSVSVLSSSGTLTPALRSAIAVIPLVTPPAANNGLVSFDSGTLTLQSRTLDGLNLALHEPAGSLNATTVVLVDTTIGLDSQISVRNDNGLGSTMPRIAIAGRVELDGTMAFAGNPTAISIAQGASFVNEGSMAIDAHAAQFTGNGTLINDGVIVLTGDGTSGAIPRIDTSVTGSGFISLVAGASVEIGASVGASETVWLGTGANTLHLAQLGAFAGQIGGFSAGDQIVLDGATVTAALASHVAETDSTVVTLLNGSSVVGTLRFSALDAGTIFQLGADTSGTPTLALASAASPADAGTVNVYRFFDAAHGTQLLTQDPAERDAIIGGRPDLRYEGVGLHALDPARADADAIAIYRFFDLSNGTHFMTASAAERDTLIASRPDMVFEPGSTLFEHATAQPGDSAVYRFFDSQSGAHFFTADADERASIIATRPDMTAEGIAFYAPTV